MGREHAPHRCAAGLAWIESGSCGVFASTCLGLKLSVGLLISVCQVMEKSRVMCVPYRAVCDTFGTLYVIACYEWRITPPRRGGGSSADFADLRT